MTKINRNDPTTGEVVASLSKPVVPALLELPDLSRRRFLQASGAAAAISLLPMWLAEAAEAATPLGANDGVVVVLTMGGGNDGLNTFVPFNDGAYYDARGNLAIQGSNTLPLTANRGLNPNLPFMKTLWDRGHVAVVEGVGHAGSNLSHFLSMAQIMSANANGQPGTSGWLGRAIDGFSPGPLAGIAIGSSVPLAVQGRSRSATAIPVNGNAIRKLERSKPSVVQQYDTVLALGNSSTGLGTLADRITGSMGEAIDLSDQLRPLMVDEADEPQVVTKLRLAARLINANLGIRVIHIIFGDFDSHANQATMHTSRMQEINAGLQAFYGILSANFANRTLVVGTSEFGRRVKANATGTDHGTANAMFAIGSRVNGGLHGRLPSLTALNSDRNMVPTVDYRQFYGNILSTWLGVDTAEVLGRNHPDLGFLRSPGGSAGGGSDDDDGGGGDDVGGGTDSGGGGGSVPPVVTVNGRRARRAEVARLYLAYFLREPDEDGLEYWVGVRESGRSLREISTEFVSSGEFRRRYGALGNNRFVRLVYNNVLERSPDPDGLAYWNGQLNSGVSRGDVMVGFSESAEFKKRTGGEIKTIEHNGPIGRLYVAYFLRRPDDDGLDYWINTGLPTAAVSEEFAQSSEFRNRYGALSNAAFVTLAYRNVLDRAPDPAGRNHWVSALNRGVSRGAVMQGFSDSAEFIQRVKNL